MADWSTISSLATAGGTLILALATFSSVRSANRSARVAESALQLNLRPLLFPSHDTDRTERIRVVKVAGASYRADALQDDGFEPGRKLALVPEPENEHDPNALAIWNEELTLQAGYVPAEIAPEVPRDWQAVSLWEFRGEDGERIGLRVLLAPPDAWIGLPRA